MHSVRPLGTEKFFLLSPFFYQFNFSCFFVGSHLEKFVERENDLLRGEEI